MCVWEIKSQKYSNHSFYQINLDAAFGYWWIWFAEKSKSTACTSAGIANYTGQFGKEIYSIWIHFDLFRLVIFHLNSFPRCFVLLIYVFLAHVDDYNFVLFYWLNTVQFHYFSSLFSIDRCWFPNCTNAWHTKPIHFVSAIYACSRSFRPWRSYSIHTKVRLHCSLCFYIFTPRFEKYLIFHFSPFLI